MSEVLSAKGFDVILASDGYEAIRVLTERHVDLLLTDIVMPGISGFEFELAPENDLHFVCIDALNLLYREQFLGVRVPLPIDGAVKFIEHDLDYDRIQQVALGSVHNPNSSFRGDGKETEATTIGRWKRMFSAPQVRDVESSIGNLLVDTGYTLETSPADLHPSPAVRLMNFLYPLYFDFKLWLKSDTPLARIADKGRMGVRVPESDASATAETGVEPRPTPQN